jgi:type IV pilus assembly protein PilC
MSVDIEGRPTATETSTTPAVPRGPSWRQRLVATLSSWLGGSGEAAGPPSSVSIEAGANLARPYWTELSLFGKASSKLMAAFCRQFAAYLESGVTLVRALDSLRRQFKGTVLGPVVGRLGLEVRRGSSLTDAFNSDAGSYDRLFITTMHAAEARGAVPETLKMLSEHYVSRQRIHRQARSALIYPSIVIFLTACLGTLLTVWVLPILVDLLTDLVKHTPPKRLVNFSLPWPTRTLMGLSEFVRQGGWWIIPTVLAALFLGPWILYRTRPGKTVLDYLALHVPLLGNFLLMIDSSRFARTLSALLGSGIDIGSSLELSSEVVTLVPLRNAVLRSRDAVMEGASLAASLSASRLFPGELVTVVESGEETGRLPEILLPLADDYDDQIEHFVKDIGNLIQPLILVLLGGLVRFVVIAFVLGYTTVLSRLSGVL